MLRCLTEKQHDGCIDGQVRRVGVDQIAVGGESTCSLRFCLIFAGTMRINENRALLDSELENVHSFSQYIVSGVFLDLMLLVRLMVISA